jgi:hypothetical protein
VAKMRVVLPPMLKQMLERPIHELCVRADDAYRRAANSGERKVSTKASPSSDTTLTEVGVALKAAMLDGETLESFRSAIEKVKVRHPELARSLNL